MDGRGDLHREEHELLERMHELKEFIQYLDIEYVRADAPFFRQQLIDCTVRIDKIREMLGEPLKVSY